MCYPHIPILVLIAALNGVLYHQLHRECCLNNSQSRYVWMYVLVYHNLVHEVMHVDMYVPTPRPLQYLFTQYLLLLCCDGSEARGVPTLLWWTLLPKQCYHRLYRLCSQDLKCPFNQSVSPAHPWPKRSTVILSN
jgi:hypothetical protein